MARHARSAAREPSRERIERQLIIGTVLDPSLGIIDDAVDRAEPDGALERELLFDYLTDVLYRKLASITGDGFSLRVLTDADPVDLVRAYASKAIRGGWQQVRRERARRTIVTDSADLLTSPTAHHHLPPDEIVAQRMMAPLMRRMDALQDDASASDWDIARLQADSIQEIRGLPAVTTPCNRVRRHLMELFDDPGEAETLEVLITTTLSAQRALATGRPQAEHLLLDDDLMVLWSGWGADAVDALVGNDVREAVALVKAAVMFPPRPSERELVEFRRFLRTLSHRPGWATLSARLARTWVAEWFTARNPHDRVSSPAAAEENRQAIARQWATVVREVLAFEGHPLGAGIHDAETIHRRLWRQYEYMKGLIARAS